MRKIVKIDDSLRYRRGNWQNIKHSVKRGSFVTYHGQRLYLDMFLRQQVEPLNIHGVYGTSYFSAYGIELSNCGDMARVYLLLS
jgi:hypothetical protein